MRRILVLGLLLAVSLSALAGCGGGKETGPEPTHNSRLKQPTAK